MGQQSASDAPPSVLGKDNQRVSQQSIGRGADESSRQRVVKCGVHVEVVIGKSIPYRMGIIQRGRFERLHAFNRNRSDEFAFMEDANHDALASNECTVGIKQPGDFEESRQSFDDVASMLVDVTTEEIACRRNFGWVQRSVGKLRVQRRGPDDASSSRSAKRFGQASGIKGVDEGWVLVRQPRTGRHRLIL